MLHSSQLGGRLQEILYVGFDLGLEDVGVMLDHFLDLEENHGERSFVKLGVTDNVIAQHCELAALLKTLVEVLVGSDQTI